MLQIKYSNTWHNLPMPSSMPVGEELIWGSNTGRNSSGTMIGDFKGYKATIECSWRVLTLAEMQTLRSAIRSAISENPFFNIKYDDIEGGVSQGSVGVVEKTVYVSDMPREIYSLASGKQFYTNVKMTFIEK